MRLSKCPPSAPATLQVCHVTYQYDEKKVLDDVSFEVPQGKSVAVVGPNGAGKSTLFKILVGLVRPHSGEVSIHGQQLGQHHDCVSYVPQNGEVDVHFPVTVADVVLMGRAGYTGWFQPASRADYEQTSSALRKLGIADLARRRLDELSGGQIQRAFLARAIAQQPHVLLMDEPFTGVDLTTQEVTLNLLDDLRNQSATVLVSTHDLNLASQRFDLVALLNNRLVAFGAPDTVFTHANISKAFGDHLLNMQGALLIDECCPPGREGDHR